MSLIEVKDLTKTFNPGEINEFQALRGITFSVAEGEFVAIMGVSGSGKSTLMNILGCLDRPTTGQYFFAGDEVEKKSSHELVEIRRNRIGFVFQNFNLLPRLTAIANVELPLIYSGVPPSDREKKAYHALERVGLEDKVKHKPSMMSGGEQQRVAIARALINKPSLILADEPTGNLDTKSGAKVMDVLKELNTQGATIIVVTHDQAIADHTKRTIQIQDGKVIKK